MTSLLPSTPRRLKSALRKVVAVAVGLVGVFGPAPWSHGATGGSEDAIGVVEEPEITDKERRHWSFRPLVRPPVPEVQTPERIRNPLDAFVMAGLEAQGLSFSPEADRRTLIRRLSFNLTGLPPTPEEVEGFVSDRSDRAYENLVDRLLASPGYGERWAQHWLDVARFAESDGFEHDHVRTNAWRYRDWVIRALNRDVPVDRFIQLQIAGDELAPRDPEAALATGFLLSGPDMPDINSNDERRHIAMNEITSTVGSAFLGLTMGCAQCHDHKYDPVSQADFYRLRAFFDPIQFPARNKQLPHRVTVSATNAPASHLMVRGDYRRPGPELEPGTPRVLAVAGGSSSVESDIVVGRRTRLARWLTRPDHPLTTRVFVNRVWQHHFGRPLVGTPNDFGLQGDEPTHPELLDWLATELPRLGWSLKKFHKRIVMSATYRQASVGEGAAWVKTIAVDPENRWYGRMNRHRLSGEVIRDALLAIAGELNREPFGPGFRPPLPAEVTVTLLKNQWPVTEDVAEHHRRSVYLFARRNLRFPMFEVFDRPDALASCARRHRSTTAPQALTLLNSEFSLDRARGVAGMILEEFDGDSESCVRGTFKRILGRPPLASELAFGLAFLDEQRGMPEGGGVEVALAQLALALFNTNEFIYVD